MVDLNKLSLKDLLVEVEKIKKEHEYKKPVFLKNPDFSRLRKLLSVYITELEENSAYINEDEHRDIIFYEIMSVFYYINLIYNRCQKR